MTRFFPKTFARTAIVTALSASLAFSPVAAAPAYAGDRDAGAIAAASFFALITAGIIASAAKDNAGRVTIDRHAPKASRPGAPRGHQDRGPNRADPRKALPNQCEFTIHRGPDRGTYYGRNCLVRNFDYWPYLPDRCETRVKGQGNRSVKAYAANCLARYSYNEQSRGPRSSRR
jgi:hypothetical protein